MSRLAPFSGGLLRLALTTAGTLALVVAGLVVADAIRLPGPVPAMKKSTLSYEDSDSDQTSPVPRADRRFLAVAAALNAEALELARVSADRATHDSLRKFGERLTTEHRAIAEQLKSLAARKNVPVSSEGIRERVRHRLAEHAEVASDKVYLRELTNTHEDARLLFENAARESDDVELREFARRAHATLKGHGLTISRLRQQLN